MVQMFGNHPHGSVPVPATVPIKGPVVVQDKEQVVSNEILYPDLLGNRVATAEVLVEIAPPLEALTSRIDRQDFGDIRDIDQIEMFQLPKVRVPETRPPRMPQDVVDYSPIPQGTAALDSVATKFFSLRGEK